MIRLDTPGAAFTLKNSASRVIVIAEPASMP